jgi:uncharacterized protein YceH (UPF0502 family)
LREKNLAYVFHGSEARAPKYGHLFPKAFDLSEAEIPLMCVLILRGPQTSGELRSRTQHLRSFESLAEVETLLQGLSLREEPLIVKLPRQPGSRESRFAHLLGGPVEMEQSEAPPHLAPSVLQRHSENDKIAKLEEEIASLRMELSDLKQQFAELKRELGG